MKAMIVACGTSRRVLAMTIMPHAVSYTWPRDRPVLSKAGDLALEICCQNEGITYACLSRMVSAWADKPMALFINCPVHLAPRLFCRPTMAALPNCLGRPLVDHGTIQSQGLQPQPMRHSAARCSTHFPYPSKGLWPVPPRTRCLMSELSVA